MSEFYNVWHITNDEMHFVASGISMRQARYLADVLQELHYLGILPGEFYMAVPQGSDTDWLKEATSSTLDYAQMYGRYEEQVAEAVLLRYGRDRYEVE